ncbi:unnamed protein product [Gongylonema pulchrum]|uniref:Oxidoreductase-like domain-containing protein n=1 Tax=Gongylonema pulchrum TaxID=637853 RepID=A0A183DN46_9BILA|nr:unnamed protein product [Gongylonema pulchrum]
MPIVVQENVLTSSACLSTAALPSSHRKTMFDEKMKSMEPDLVRSLPHEVLVAQAEQTTPDGGTVASDFREQTVQGNKKKAGDPQEACSQLREPRRPDPSECCGAGCANCVWIEYGTQLIQYYGDRPLQDALDEIDKSIADVALREFVKGEVRARALHPRKCA